MIRFASIGDPESLTWIDYDRQVGDFSPNGRSVAVVIRRGNPRQETTEGALLLYRTAELLDDPRPRVLAQFASASNYQPIAKVRWLDDRTLVFAGTRARAPSQIYRVDVGSGKLTQLSEEATQPKWYDISASGRRLVVFSALPPDVEPARDPECLQRGCRVTSGRFYDADRGGNLWNEIWGAQVASYDLRAGTRKVISGPDRATEGGTQCFYGFIGGLSPDGRYGLQLCELHNWPRWWSEYRFDEDLQRNLRAGNSNYARQLFLFDLQTGAHRPLTGAPSAPNGFVPLWINQGRQAVLAGAAEPLAETAGEERDHRASRWGVLVVEPATARIERLGDLPPGAVRVTGASWNEPSSVLTIETADKDRKALPAMVLQRANGAWKAVSAGGPPPVAVSASVKLLVRQSPNERPVLVAEDRQTGTRKEVLDPNPWLAHIKLGRVEEISWTPKGKPAWHGMLFYPVDYRQGQRYPLVMQMHGMRPAEFSLDGYVRNFAAQPLAARDIMVLQIAEDRSLRDVITTPQEWPAVRAGLEGAIDELDARGLIDRTRVGTVGWSRTGPHTGYALTHSSYPFAAAVMLNSSDFGWFAYFTWDDAREFDLDYGGAPFGKEMKSWLETVPSFNLERLRTPVLLMNAHSVLGHWDWYAALRRLAKPVEYWVLPDGEHDVFKVGQRKLVNTLTVDWFDFWLNGREAGDPAKAEQYRRWRALREQQKAVLATPRPPLYEWTAKPLPEPSPRR